MTTQKIRERPILFSAPMIRAILSGRKTQTRRIVKPGKPCPYGQAGERLWVREAWGRHPESPAIVYRADADCLPHPFGRLGEPKWRPSIHMPRAYSRILLEITGIRQERLHDISNSDALAEGVEPRLGYSAAYCFARLWESIHGPDAWGADPLVWVVGFQPVKAT